MQQEDVAQCPGVCEELGTDEFATKFAALPSGLITDLEQAILNVSLDQMYRLIEQIREQEDALADALKDYVDNFEYEEILRLIQSEQENSE